MLVFLCMHRVCSAMDGCGWAQRTPLCLGSAREPVSGFDCACDSFVPTLPLEAVFGSRDGVQIREKGRRTFLTVDRWHIYSIGIIPTLTHLS